MFPDDVIKELWVVKFGHEYPVLHNQYKVKRDKDGCELSVANVNEKNNNNSLITQFFQLHKEWQFGFNLMLLVAIFVFVNLL
jgi:hypothetical protein